MFLLITHIFVLYYIYSFSKGYIMLMLKTVTNRIHQKLSLTNFKKKIVSKDLKNDLF